MPVVIAATLGLLGVIGSTWIGLLSGPGRHLRRLQAITDLLKSIDEAHVSTARAPVAEALAYESMLFHHRSLDAYRRRHGWFAIGACTVVTACAIGLAVVVNNTDASERERDWTSVGIIAAILLVEAVSASVALRMVEGVDKRSQEDYLKLTAEANAGRGSADDEGSGDVKEHSGADKPYEEHESTD